MENKFILISPDRATPQPLEHTFMTPLLFSTYKDKTPQPRLRESSNDIPVYDNDYIADVEKDLSWSELKNVSINSSTAIDLTDNEDNVGDTSARSTEVQLRASRVGGRNDEIHSLNCGNVDMNSRDEGDISDAVIDLCDDFSVDEPRFHAESDIVDKSPYAGAADRSFNCRDIEFAIDQESFLEKHHDSGDDLSEPASPCVTTTQGERKQSNEGTEGSSQGQDQDGCKNPSLNNSGSSKNEAINLETEAPSSPSENEKEGYERPEDFSKYGAIDSGNSSDELIDTTPKKSLQENTTNRGSTLIDLEMETPVSSSGNWLRAHSDILYCVKESSSSQLLSPRRKSTPKRRRRVNPVSESSAVSDKGTDKCKRKTKTKRSTPSKKKSPPKKKLRQDTSHTAGKGAFKELLKRVSNEVDGRNMSDSDVTIDRRMSSNNPSTSDDIEELLTNRNLSEVEALIPNRNASKTASTSDEIEELHTKRSFSEIEALNPNRPLQSHSLSIAEDNYSVNDCQRNSEISRNRRTRDKFDVTVVSNNSPISGSHLTKSYVDLSGRSANRELPIDFEDQDDCSISYPSFSQSFGDDGGFNVDICTQGQAGANRSLKGSEPDTTPMYHGLNASPTLDTNDKSAHADRDVATSRNDLRVSFIDDRGFNCDLAVDVTTQDGESNAGSPSVVKVAARKRSTNASSTRQRICMSTNMESSLLAMRSNSREMASSLQEACTPSSDAMYRVQRNELARLDLNQENLPSGEESRDENNISNLGDLPSWNCESDFVFEGNSDAGRSFSSVSENVHDNNETLQDQGPSTATPRVQAPMNVSDTPSTAVRNFTHGIGIHPETGAAITPMSDYDSLSTPALAVRILNVKKSGVAMINAPMEAYRLLT